MPRITLSIWTSKAVPPERTGNCIQSLGTKHIEENERECEEKKVYVVGVTLLHRWHWHWRNAVHQLYLHILFSKRDDGRIYLATSLNPPRSFRLLFIKFSDPISSDALLQCLFSLTFRKLDAYSCQLKDMRLWRHISPDAKLIFWRVVGLYEFCK